jgi:hypothetical protein
MRPGTQTADVDRILYWPIILAVAGPLVSLLPWIALAILGYPFIIVVLLGPILTLIPMAWAGAGAFAAMTCFFWAYERAWRRVVSTLILPATILVAGLNFEVIWRATQTAGDYAHFFLLYPSLRADIEKLPADKPRFLAWGWQATMTHELGIAYDESDEIASGRPSDAWKKRAEQVGVAGSGYRPLYGHFYLVDLE